MLSVWQNESGKSFFEDWILHLTRTACLRAIRYFILFTDLIRSARGLWLDQHLNWLWILSVLWLSASLCRSVAMSYCSRSPTNTILLLLLLLYFKKCWQQRKGDSNYGCGAGSSRLSLRICSWTVSWQKEFHSWLFPSVGETKRPLSSTGNGNTKMVLGTVWTDTDGWFVRSQVIVVCGCSWFGCFLRALAHINQAALCFS